MHLLEPKREANPIINQIKNSLQGVCDDVFRRNPPPSIISHSTYEPGFDWYFPNFATNTNAPDFGRKGIFYDEYIVKGLLEDLNYRQNFLKLTRHYFECAGLMDDAKPVEYHGIRSHMVRLDKIIQSYRILLCYCDDVSIPDSRVIAEFKRDLRETYKQVYRRFYSDKQNYFMQNDSYHGKSIAMIFDSDLETMVFPSERIREDMEERPLAIKTYSSDSKKSYREIEEGVEKQINGNWTTSFFTLSASSDTLSVRPSHPAHPAHQTPAHPAPPVQTARPPAHSAPPAQTARPPAHQTPAPPPAHRLPPAPVQPAPPAQTARPPAPAHLAPAHPAQTARPPAPPAQPVPLAPPAPARPAQSLAPAHPAPPSKDPNFLVKDRVKGLIYGQAIFDAMGLTTEFMGINQAKLVMYLSGVANVEDTGNGFYDLKVNQTNISQFLSDPYKIRKDLACNPLDLANHGIHQHLNQHYCTDGGQRGDSRSASDPSLGPENQWRQLVPKGSFTDDTDQAVLKFHALKNANGDITKAVKLYASYLKDWKEGKSEEFFGKISFGLGGNTKQVIEGHTDETEAEKSRSFTEDPFAVSKKVWRDLAIKGEFNERGEQTMPPHFAQANGALMSSSYVLQFFPNSLELAQQATAEFAKVTHYDPLVSAHCVAYVTMLYHLMHHQGEVDDNVYKGFLKESYQAGKKFFDDRKSEYEEVYDPSKFQGVSLDKQLRIWDNQMYKAIYGEISYIGGRPEKFSTWEDLQLVNPNVRKGGDRSLRSDQPYDNIGMSHRALSAGFFGLRKLREYEGSGLSRSNALAKVCIEMTAQGGDADTNGTIVGSLCGAYVGFSNIPKSLVDGLGMGDKGNGFGKVRDDRHGNLLMIKEKELLEGISQIAENKITASQSFSVDRSTNQDGYTLVRPHYYNKKLFHSRITSADSSGYVRDLNFRYLSAFNSGEIRSSEQAYQKIADNLIEAMKQAKIDDKEFVKRAIKIAQKHGGLSNFFDDEGQKINDHQKILEIINQGKDQDEKPLSVDNLNAMMRLSFYFQRENQRSSILTGRLNGSTVGLRLAYVSDEVIARFSLPNISPRSAQRQ
jgi:ADP-ribosylglycohydrolase